MSGNDDENALHFSCQCLVQHDHLPRQAQAKHQVTQEKRAFFGLCLFCFVLCVDVKTYVRSNRLEIFERTKAKEALWPYAKDVVYENAMMFATADARL